MPAATLLLLVYVDIDPLDVDADEAARAVLDVESRVRSALKKRRVRMGGVSHVIVPVGMDQVGAVLGTFAESVEKRRG
jgi:predicted solute-binding protein